MTQLADLKADIASLESRFNCNLVSEVNSLRSNQKDLISIIREQDQIIHTVIDDNSLESLIQKIIDNGPENNNGSLHSKQNDLSSSILSFVIRSLISKQDEIIQIFLTRNIFQLFQI